MYNKKTEKEFENNKQVYIELAERRTIEILGLTEKEVLYAKAFETTKVVELNNLKNKICNTYPKKREQITWQDILFRRFN